MNACPLVISSSVSEASPNLLSFPFEGLLSEFCAMRRMVSAGVEGKLVGFLNEAICDMDSSVDTYTRGRRAESRARTHTHTHTDTRGTREGRERSTHTGKCANDVCR